ncbi:MAG: NADH:flavin oxidoreductase/NADH oxidase [Gemmatimonadota bacterium]|jgi:2,4-dienoyl-CoA reductase-like NADH-dependent reductase (Old Yellow Enzyme family)
MARVPLFDPLTVRGITFRNRVFVSPMCEYSAEDGLPNDWHMVHLGSRAVGGAGLVLTEATAVCPEGRISPADTGLWNDAHAGAFRRITRFIRSQGSVPGIQLAHAGRKASTKVPWVGRGEVDAEQGPWQTVAPSAIAFADHYPMPRALTGQEIDGVVAQWVAAARLALEAEFDVIELHMAHGYLAHEFLSPLSNHRTDDYGGTLENRMRFPLRMAAAVRAVWPERLPLFVRISATDWTEGGWDIDQSVRLSEALRDIGVDLIDCSSGGNVGNAKIPVGPGYQVPFAERIRREARIATGAVGLITEPEQANAIVAEGRADAVIMARELLRRPYWPLHAARTLGVDVAWPNQYLRAKPR